MIYFKFPFNESLYTISNQSEEKAIEFLSFDQSKSISFLGNITEVKDEDFHDLKLSSEILPIQNLEENQNSQEKYIQQLNQVIDIIKENNLPKIVLSRRKIFSDFDTIDFRASFQKLCTTYPNAFRYFFIKDNISWMGAFSEVLGKFNKKTNEFETMSLAGTLPLEEYWSTKEIEEQKPVSTYIKNILNQYTDAIEESETYDHISGNIKHLRTDFKAKISPEKLDQLILELHPTPAVCGIPKDFCKDVISKIEPHSRELYAGYIKIETEEYVQYFVNLRCARFYKNAVQLYVGGGITVQSDPLKEWRETELKSEAVLKNLVYS